MEKFISEIKNRADKVAKKSGELVEISKTKLSMANTKSEISSNFKILGELVYLSQKASTESDPQKIEETISKIDELYERLGELSELNSMLKNEKNCPNCKKSNSIDAQFCSGCGYKFSNNDSEDAIDTDN